jgi:hypothetical protein
MKSSAIGRLKRKKGGQQDPRSLTLSIDGLAGQTDRPMVNRRSVDGKEEGSNQGDTPKARHDGGGSIYD